MLLLLACAHHPPGGDLRATEIAPFQLEKPATALWIEEPRRDASHVAGWLLLTDRPVTCRDLAAELGRDATDAASLLWTTSGVLARLEVEAPEGKRPSIPGTYYAMAPEPLGPAVEPIRRLSLRAFSGGAHYALTDTWGSCEVERTDGQMRGSFDTELLSGRFEAKICPQGVWR